MEKVKDGFYLMNSLEDGGWSDLERADNPNDYDNASCFSIGPFSSFDDAKAFIDDGNTEPFFHDGYCVSVYEVSGSSIVNKTKLYPKLDTPLLKIAHGQLVTKADLIEFLKDVPDDTPLSPEQDDGIHWSTSVNDGDCFEDRENVRARLSVHIHDGRIAFLIEANGNRKYHPSF